MKSAFLSMAALLLAAAPAAAADSARYNVTFDGTWSQATHPLDYPAGAHFSGLIGATHNRDYSVFEEGGTATPGLEKLAEMGAHSPLDAEIRAAVGAGTAGALIEGRPIFGPPGQAMIEFKIDARHPFVSLVAMIAPSPDWFAGAANVELMENGRWVAEKRVTLHGWDAGTDGGITYQAADADTIPRMKIGVNEAPHFRSNAQRRPVGTLVFRISE